MPRLRYFFLYSGGCFFELAKFTIGVVVLGVLTHYFIFTVIPIKGASMEPNFHDADWVVLNKLSYLLRGADRGDAVAVRFPGDPKNEKYIKRIIGLPGETIKIQQGNVFINDRRLEEAYIPNSVATWPETQLTLEQDEYYLLGDNRLNSSDSRIWGPVTHKELVGKAKFIIFPFSRYRYIYAPTF